MAGRYEYKVEEVREGMIGGKMSGDKLEKVLNAARPRGLAAQGDHRRRDQGPGRVPAASRAS